MRFENSKNETVAPVTNEQEEPKIDARLSKDDAHDLENRMRAKIEVNPYWTGDKKTNENSRRDERNRAIPEEVKKKDYENALKDVTKELTYTNYVSSPVAADKKTYPIRWLIIVITTLTTFIFSMIVIMLLENAKKKEEEKISKAEGA